MNSFLPERKKIDAGIDMTPLIDVVFQLLIFLMVSAQFVAPPEKVTLPSGALPKDTVLTQNTSKPLLITITAENTLILNGDDLTIEQLKPALESALIHSDPPRLEIRGDTSSHLGSFITVLETAQALGIEAISYHKKAPQTQ